MESPAHRLVSVNLHLNGFIYNDKLQHVSLFSLQGCYSVSSSGLISRIRRSKKSPLCSVLFICFLCHVLKFPLLISAHFLYLLLFPLPTIDRSTCVFSTMRWPIPMNASATLWQCTTVAGRTLTCFICFLCFFWLKVPVAAHSY